jgi:rhodanese-related sulfurtransferase/rubrerythrin
MGAKARTMDTEQARDIVESGDFDEYVLLDVRGDWEYENGHLPGAIHIPVSRLAGRTGELDPSRPVLVYCHSGRRSYSAAGILSRKGFDARSIEGGIAAWEGGTAHGPPDTGFQHLGSPETAGQVLKTAWNMEEALRKWYAGHAQVSRDQEFGRLLHRLAAFEKGHKALILDMARKADETVDSAADLDDPGMAGVLEGGVRLHDVKAQYLSQTDTVWGLLDAAMMFEAQAMDLYLRFSRTEQGQAHKDLLTELAGQEQDHLEALGDWLERLG